MNPYNQITISLLAWYDKNARDLPWRRNPAPYRVWVSEIMLQQTRVETVLPYFERFVAALPDIPALAQADENLLMKLWEGLGYYGRARNLHRAARIVMEKYGGELPSSPEELRSLPGIGDYASGAIASIAFGRPAAAVDGNVLRVLARLLASREDVASPATKHRFRLIARDMLPESKPGDFNQAMMDLGATVCIPGAEPRCNVCPLCASCEGRRKGIQAELPVKAAKKPRAVAEVTILILKSGEKTLLVRRPPKGLLAGLWGPVALDGWLDEREVTDRLASRGAAVRSIRKIEDSKHVFTHVEWRMNAFTVEADEFIAVGDSVWADAEDLKKYAVPSAFKAYKKYF